MAASAPQTATLAIRGPLERADLPGLFARTRALLANSEAEVLRCEVSQLAADAVAVDALARLALAARRSGCRVRLCGASVELYALIAFVGLGDVLAG
ncbi:MAG TPA: STAS domain-containing protein [Solirubrobacteraceae bacterium]|nr:STAS domain-containing protein [Solirubrobacteraceae bacterium]